MNSKLNENYGDNIFCQEQADEMYRLQLVAETYDFISQRQLSALLTHPDLRCLDIGSGSGSIAEWLTKQSNVKEVVALDRFTHLLEERIGGLDKLQIVQHDLNNDDFTGNFDIINIRFVLMHLRNRNDILKKVITWLNPGGWIVVSDIFDFPQNELNDPLYQKIMSTMWQVLIRTIGTDRNWSITINSKLKSFGLRNINNEVYLPNVSKGSPMAEFWSLTWHAMRAPLLEMSDLSESILADAENRLRQGDMVALSPGIMTCIGQK